MVRKSVKKSAKRSGENDCEDMSSCYTEDIMLDPELRDDLENIEQKLSHLDKETAGTWRTLWHGVVYGAGYIIGAVVIIVVIGWTLNIVGVIPALARQAGEFRAALQRIGGPIK